MAGSVLVNVDSAWAATLVFISPKQRRKIVMTCLILAGCLARLPYFAMISLVRFSSSIFFYQVALWICVVAIWKRSTSSFELLKMFRLNPADLDLDF
jgi:hypothetical protein